MGAMRRREFLTRSASAAGAAALATGPLATWRDLADLLGRSEESNWPFAKCIALGGPQAQGGTPSISLYSHVADEWAGSGSSNEAFIRRSNTGWVKIQISWWQLQELWGPPAAELPADYNYPDKLPPSNWVESWHHLNFASNINELAGLDAATINPGIPALRRLDREIAAANRDGIRVLLSLYHDFPTWTSTRADAIDSGAAFHGELWNGVPPDDLGTDGPWAWFIGHLLARYRPGAPANPIGPHLRRGAREALAGNPERARIDALEICNEPNTLLDSDDPAEPIARMIETALSLAGGSAPTPTGRVRIPLLAPATADDVDISNSEKMSWEQFTDELLARLNSARIDPRNVFRWSQHNYGDVKHPIGPGQTSRAGLAAGKLSQHDWFAQTKPLWLTEGGYRLPAGATEIDEQTQAARIAQNYLSMSKVPQVALWTQYKIAASDGFDSSLRRAPTDGRIGAPRASWSVWTDLPAPVN